MLPEFVVWSESPAGTSLQGEKRTASEDPEAKASKRGKKSSPEGPAPGKAPGVGVKTGGSRVGGPKQCVLGSMVTGDNGHNVFTQVRALLMEVKPYILLD